MMFDNKDKKQEYEMAYLDGGPVEVRGDAVILGRGSLASKVSGLFIFLLFMIAFALPNLVYSGSSFHQGLHLMKWVVALVPVAIGSVLGGADMAFNPNSRRYGMDWFGIFWFLFFVLISVQPLWVRVNSFPGYVREWFFFAGCWAVYVLSLNFFKNKWLRPLIWITSLGGAVNVLFAELQIRQMAAGFNELFPWNVLMPANGHYIGNTGQQNMLGLWLAMAIFGSLYLFVIHGGKFLKSVKDTIMVPLNFAFYVFLCIGLVNSTSRSAMLSFLCAIIVMAVLVALGMRNRRGALLRLLAGVLIFFSVYGVIKGMDSGRAASLRMKTGEIAKDFESVAGRRDIWRNSAQMFKMYPQGVGLGQYKWHYLEAQYETLKRYSVEDMPWQFTMWAHNEILQWFCEFGWYGGVALLLVGGFWLIALLRYLVLKRVRRKGDAENISQGGLSEEFIWAVAFLFMIWFNALWTRPFHRIENAIWMCLAFAIANRHMFRTDLFNRGVLSFVKRALGLLMVIVSVVGIVYLNRGVNADMLLRKAMVSEDMILKGELLAEASKSLMVRDLAERENAIFYMRYGVFINDVVRVRHGADLLMKHFLSQPTNSDLQLLFYSPLAWEKGSIDVLNRYYDPRTPLTVRPSPSVGAQQAPMRQVPGNNNVHFSAPSRNNARPLKPSEVLPSFLRSRDGVSAP